MEGRKVVRWTIDLLGVYWNNLEAKVIATDPMWTRFMHLAGLVSQPLLFQDKHLVRDLPNLQSAF
jgi:hypothetical protein